LEIIASINFYVFYSLNIETYQILSLVIYQDPCKNTLTKTVVLVFTVGKINQANSNEKLAKTVNYILKERNINHN